MSKIRVADYIARRIVEHGVHHVFMVTGGGAMHLNDAFGKNSALKCIFNHHEQACAIAAEGYTRSSGKLCVVNVTTGPGGLNTLTGVLGQWTDSVPAIYISGQVKFETTVASCKSIPLRQLGDQECSIIDVVSPLTKFAVMLTDPLDCKKVIDTAIFIATSGRPGPVWIDIPLNVQGAIIEESKIREESTPPYVTTDVSDVKESVNKIIHELRFSKRPLIIAGHGIRISKSETIFNEVIDTLRIPVVTTFNGFDLLPDSHPLCIGRIGTIGQRAGNFALQNADLILFFGTRNNIRQVSYNWKTFAKNAKKVVIDIDNAELEKPTLFPDIPIIADIKHVLIEFNRTLQNFSGNDWSEWLMWCKKRTLRYPTVLPEYMAMKTINPYYFIQVLTELMAEDATVVCGNGSACVCTFQAGIVKKNQRFFWNSGCASMGYDLPAALGACFALDKKPIICIAGDGSLMMNLQELQTVKHYNLPIKIIILNNGGYQSIKQTQSSFFGLPFIGCDQDSGVGFPDFIRVAEAFGIQGIRIHEPSEMKEKLTHILSSNQPIVCEVMLSRDYIFSPKLSSKRQPDGTIVSPSLEDMYPFLSPEELKENIIVQ
jgi:acetolactate synthase I/II/III large subunit